MTVEYTFDGEAKRLRLHNDPNTNTMDLTREQAERIAQRIADQGGYARVLLGGSVFAEYGEDPRHL